MGSGLIKEKDILTSSTPKIILKRVFLHISFNRGPGGDELGLLE